MKGYKNRFRTLAAEGKVKTFPTREAAHGDATTVAARTGSWVGIEEWSADHPQDEVNQGWALIDTVEPPGQERPKRDLIRLDDVQPGDAITVFAHAPRFDLIHTRGMDYTGVVKRLIPAKVGSFATYVIAFEDGRSVEAVQNAATTRAVVPVQ